MKNAVQILGVNFTADFATLLHLGICTKVEGFLVKMQQNTFKD